MATAFSASLLATCTVVFLSLIGQISTQDATLAYSIREEREPNTYIGSVALDSGLFANVSNEKFKQLQFQILREGNDKVNYFRIEQNTSLLWTNSRIDREEFTECYDECYIDFNVAVFDMEKLDFTQVIRIVINVIDYNDNVPSFIPVDSPILIPESTSRDEIIMSGAAIDHDQSLENSVQSYTLLPDTAYFGLRTVEMDDSGKEFELFLKTELNRESVASFDLIILAKDGGTPQKTGTLSLKVLITDVNDNPPQFTHSIYNASISENLQLDTTVIRVQASDSDLGDYGKVSYQFSNRISDDILQVFRLDSSNGDLIVIGTIDYEVHTEFVFQVIAYDHGVPSQSSTADIHIRVTDMNDNSPVVNLNLPPGGTIIAEDAKVGSFVTHVEVIDKDAGKNGHVVCNILDPHFRIESYPGIEDNYQIVLNKSLDHDAKPEHNVTILCKDNADEPRQTSVHFIVHVEDVNDNAPVFEKDFYSVDIDENNEVGIEIVTVFATDLDSGSSGVVSYSMHPELGGLFMINAFTGLITAVVSLDRETHGNQVMFRVYSKDDGKEQMTGTGTVVVNIKDVNDNAPIFDSSPFRFNVTENMSIGTKVGNLSAHDPDNGSNGTFYFKFPEDPDILEYFMFHESGIVTTNKQLDREQLAFHQFFIEAVDMGGLSSTVLVIVSVNDINDNYPEIIYPNEYDNVVSIPYELSESLEVLHVEARDYDMDENARLYYYIEQDNSSYTFRLDVNSGSLILNRTLHEKNIGETYQFLLKVKDSGEPALSSWTTLNIKIIAGKSAPIIQESASQHNLWIVIGIVIFTAILSVTMILIMVKICWCGRRKQASASTSDIVTDSKNDSDAAYMDSASDGSTSSKDTNSNLKIKENAPYMLQNSYQKSYYGDISERDYVANSSTLDGHMYLEHINKLDLEKPLDESISDNSGEMGTRDSGQGGSDMDNISLLDIPHTHTHGPVNATSSVNSSQNHQVNHSNTYYHGNRQQAPHLSNSYHGNSTPSDLQSESSLVTTSVANYSMFPTKTAERKELSKLRTKGQKRVMFSDDLENSHSSGRSSTMSTQSYLDTQYSPFDPNSPRRLNRLLSEDSAIVMNDRFNRANDWLRRSADSLTWRQNGDKIYNQLPSNQIKSSVVSDNTCAGSNQKPMSSNIKTYLDKVMGRNRNNSLSECPSDTLRSNDSNDVFMTSGSSFQGENMSRDGGSTTTSGSYHLGNPTFLSLNSDSTMEDVFA